MAPRKATNEERTMLASSVDNTIDLMGKRKRYCPGCGLRRSVSYAEIAPCAACGSFGTQRRLPVFDEFGDVITEKEG